MKKRTHNLLLALICGFAALAQNNTFSPYSRYGLGELSSRVFAHNLGMGGAHIALKPDSSMPVYINAGNPAAYALIRITSLEVGGQFTYSSFKSSASTLRKWGTNFSYGALGFPVGKRAGASFGILPYSSVGYDTESRAAENAGTVTYRYSGSGGLTKAYLGYGIMPFSGLNNRFRRRNASRADSVQPISRGTYRFRNFTTKVLSDFSLGFNANYIFGNMQNTARVVYPNSTLYNNTYTERVISVDGFTGNFGAQTAITFDSARVKDGTRRALKEKVKLTFGYFMNLNNPLNGTYHAAGYSYVLTATNEELIRDTVLFNTGQKQSVTLPAEQGFGIGFKKGERINVAADFALTNWRNFKSPGDLSALSDNYRVAAGISYVPEKYASGQGAFFRRINYRFGFSYETGYIKIRNSLVSDYSVSAGLGLPVGMGRMSSVVNVSAQYGTMGSSAAGLTANYWRINFGFTFCDRWFQKYRYD